MRKINIDKVALAVLVVFLAIASASSAVTSQIVRQSSAKDLLKGETKDAVIDSEGTITLARSEGNICKLKDRGRPIKTAL